MSVKDNIGGVNNYCLTNHKMNKDKLFTLKSYQTVKKSLFFETFCLTNENKFKYELWLTKE